MHRIEPHPTEKANTAGPQSGTTVV